MQSQIERVPPHDSFYASRRGGAEDDDHDDDEEEEMTMAAMVNMAYTQNTYGTNTYRYSFRR